MILRVLTREDLTRVAEGRLGPRRLHRPQVPPGMSRRRRRRLSGNPPGDGDSRFGDHLRAVRDVVGNVVERQHSGSTHRAANGPPANTGCEINIHHEIDEPNRNNINVSIFIKIK